MQETRESRVSSLGREDPLEKEMTTHSSMLAWKIPWTEVPGGLQSMGSQAIGHDWAHTGIITDEIWCLRFALNDIGIGKWMDHSKNKFSHKLTIVLLCLLVCTIEILHLKKEWQESTGLPGIMVAESLNMKFRGLRANIESQGHCSKPCPKPPGAREHYRLQLVCIRPGLGATQQ